MQNTDQEHFMASGLNYLTNKKSLRDIDIPPRKLLSRLASASSATSPENYMDNMYHHQNEHSPRVLPEETLFKKFLPYNTGADSDDEEGDPYAADHFRIYEFKVRKCTRSRSHDWTDCPFAHPGEKARRRCPRRYNYLGTVCADFRRGSCSRGDLCEFAHGVFECWLHPSRYRTEACKDGKNCQRKICFFAHTQRQLRVVPPEPVASVVKKHHNESSHCCAHCRCHFDIHHTNSPTSTLNIDIDNLSPPASPPFSPAISGAGFSPISRFADRLARAETLGLTHLGNNDYVHQDTMNEYINNQSLNELMRSMEAMNIEDNNNEYMNMNSRWIDGGINGGEYPQFDLSPTQCGSDMGGTFARTNDPRMNNVYGETSVNNGPDLGWVNDLLT
ncbi:zinc finger CCCH domain-containing protein 2-like protein [Tanacetum coccineum]